MISKITLALAAIATVSASPLGNQAKSTTVPLKHVSNTQNAKSLISHGHARIRKANNADHEGVQLSSGPATNDAASYLAPITIGGVTYNLIVDTGSSNTWTGAQKAYKPSSTGKDTGNTFEVGYGSGQVAGEEYLDTVSFAGLTVKSQSIGAAHQSAGFKGVDGIVGFGPVDLTKNTVSSTSTVPTFLDNLYKQGSISSEVLGVYFAPESGSDDNDNNGELTLGGVDSTKYTGSISYVPTLKTGKAARYWGISVAAFSYGSTTVGSTATGIVDTGTTLIYIPTAAYNGFLKASGGKTDDNTGLASFSQKPTQNFNIKFGSKTFSLTPDQYLIPQAQYANFEIPSGKYYSWINDGGDSGVNLVIGQKFLENYYSVYDTTNAQIGFAPRA